MNDVKTFTLEEATRLIPELKKLIAPFEFCHGEILALQAQIDALELITEAGGAKDSTNADEVERLVRKMNGVAARFNEIAEKIQSYGCFIKGIHPTLIDFFHAHEGKVVYLCWRSDEISIGHWHEVGEGYGNRHPLAELGRTGFEDRELN